MIAAVLRTRNRCSVHTYMSFYSHHKQCSSEIRKPFSTHNAVFADIHVHVFCIYGFGHTHIYACMYVSLIFIPLLSFLLSFPSFFISEYHALFTILLFSAECTISMVQGLTSAKTLWQQYLFVDWTCNKEGRVGRYL